MDLISPPLPLRSRMIHSSSPLNSPRSLSGYRARPPHNLQITSFLFSMTQPHPSPPPFTNSPHLNRAACNICAFIFRVAVCTSLHRYARPTVAFLSPKPQQNYASFLAFKKHLDVNAKPCNASATYRNNPPPLKPQAKASAPINASKGRENIT